MDQIGGGGGGAAVGAAEADKPSQTLGAEQKKNLAGNDGYLTSVKYIVSMSDDVAILTPNWDNCLQSDLVRWYVGSRSYFRPRVHRALHIRPRAGNMA